MLPNLLVLIENVWVVLALSVSKLTLCGGAFIRNLMALIRRVASLHDVDGKVSKTACVIDDVSNGISIQRVANGQRRIA